MGIHAQSVPARVGAAQSEPPHPSQRCIAGAQRRKFLFRSSVLPKEAVLTPTSQPAQRLHQLESGTTTEAALAFFDSLPPVEIATMIGSWRGKGVETGHPMDGLLEGFGWHGKRFTAPDDVHPLVFDQAKGSVFSVNPAMIPVGVVLRHPDLFRHPLAGWLFRAFRFVLRTDQPKARLRMTEYRDVVSATMIYDSLPINDIFRKVDDDSVLGVMDLRFTPQPFFFVLRREGPASRAGA
jgi:Domain of unknown function (DUF4334)/GXWXG protein